jgi:hypothetical protein
LKILLWFPYFFKIIIPESLTVLQEFQDLIHISRKILFVFVGI